MTLCRPRRSLDTWAGVGRSALSARMPFLAMTRGGVALRHAPVSRTSRPVRVCGARSQAGRNDSSAKERAPVELPLPLQRRGMLLAAVGAALVLPQPQPATAAGNSSKAFVSMAFEVLEETMTGAASVQPGHRVVSPGGCAGRLDVTRGGCTTRFR